MVRTPSRYSCALLLITIGLVLTAGCGDDDGSGQNNTNLNQNNHNATPDAAAPDAAAPDAATPDAATPDAATPDAAAPDAATPDAAAPDAATSPPVTFTRYPITEDLGGPAFASVADVDDDGQLDVVVSAFGTISGLGMPDGRVVIYGHGADLTTWTLTDEVVAESDGVKFPNRNSVIDVDGDGDLDVVLPAGFLACTMGGLGSACGALMWWEQTDAGWVRHDVVESGSALFYHQAVLVDFDGDGVRDLVTVGEEQGGMLGGSDRAVPQWFKGITTGDRFETTARVMGDGLGSFPTVVDLDGDGDLDVVSAEYFVEGGSFAWLERTAEPSLQNPAGTFVRHVIADDVGPSMMIQLVPDLYGDGVLRAVGTNHTNTAQTTPDPWESATFVFDLPNDPTTAWTRHTISTGMVSDPGSMFAPMAAPGIFAAGDIDGDGDGDLLVAGDGDPRVYWLEQTGAGTWNQWVLEASLKQAGGIHVVDLDGDGRNELVVTGYEANAVYVYVRD